MYCIRPASPSTQATLRTVKLAVTFVSLILAIICIAIIRTTPTLSRQYGGMLMALIVCFTAIAVQDYIVVATTFDVYTQCVFDAQLIMPVMCIFRDAPIINIPLSACAAFITWIVLILLNAPVYAACFLHRHQIIVPQNSIFKLSTVGHVGFLVVTTVFCCSFSYTYYLAWVPGAELESSLREMISDEWDREGIRRMDCFINYKVIRNIWGVVLFFYCTIMVAAISMHTFSIIRKASYLSVTTRNYHRTLLRSLLLVALVPILFVLSPFIITLAFYKLLDPAIFTAYPMIDVCTVFLAFHSTVHSSTLILTTPMFRRRIWRAMPFAPLFARNLFVSKSTSGTSQLTLQSQSERRTEVA